MRQKISPVNFFSKIPVAVIFELNNSIKAKLQSNRINPYVDNLIASQPFISRKGYKVKDSNCDQKSNHYNIAFPR